MNTTDHSESVLSALKAVSLILLITWTIAANGLVFVVLYQNPKLRTVPNLLVANLAFSDFMLGLIVLPFSATYTVVGSWIFGKVICEMWLSCDVLICTSSIWNLSMVGLDRYWAITAPVKYMNKRTIKGAAKMIASVWGVSAAISLPPLAGWKQMSEKGNYFKSPNSNETMECAHFEDLMAYTIYSATGSFYIPMFLMFYVYYRIYKAFLDHHLRQQYRHNVLRKHLESTILRDLSHVVPDDQPKKVQLDDDDDDDADDSDESSDESSEEVCGKNAIHDEMMDCNVNETTPLQMNVLQQLKNDECNSPTDSIDVKESKQNAIYPSSVTNHTPKVLCHEVICSPVYGGTTVDRFSIGPEEVRCGQPGHIQDTRVQSLLPRPVELLKSTSESCLQAPTVVEAERRRSDSPSLELSKNIPNVHLTSKLEQSLQPPRDNDSRNKALNKNLFGAPDSARIIANRSCSPATDGSRRSGTTGGAKVRKELTFDIAEPPEIEQTNILPTKETPEKQRLPHRETVGTKAGESKKPKAISAAKEKRGVKVLGIILGCFTLCWLPFFIMYFVKAFCSSCTVNPHVEMFITWLGYANSAMNPIIYTVFNRDYQIALRRLLEKKNKLRPNF